MSAVTYARLDVVRTFRDVRFFLFSLAFPLLLFVLIAVPNRDTTMAGIPLPQYLMAGMTAWGSMTAVVAGGARIAAERSIGWHRQLRVTPLAPTVYVATKVLTGYLMALLGMAVLYGAGWAAGARLAVVDWGLMTALILVGLVPFAAMGVWFGHTLTVESMGPALGGVTSLFAVLGGSWGPIAATGALHRVAELLPSYWLVQAGRVGVAGSAWPLQAWAVVLAWSVVMLHLAHRAFRGDTARV